MTNHFGRALHINYTTFCAGCFLAIIGLNVALGNQGSPQYNIQNPQMPQEKNYHGSADDFCGHYNMTSYFGPSGTFCLKIENNIIVEKKEIFDISPSLSWNSNFISAN